MKRHHLFFIVLASVAGLLIFSGLPPSAPPTLTPTASREEKPDYAMQDVSAKHYNAAGRLQYTLHCQQLMHFASDGHLELDHIQIEHIASDNGQVSARLSAQHAIATQNLIRLQGEVKVDYLDTHAVALSTPELLYFPNEQRIVSDQPSKLNAATWRSHSERFEGQLDQQQWQQREHIQDHYEP